MSEIHSLLLGHGTVWEWVQRMPLGEVVITSQFGLLGTWHGGSPPRGSRHFGTLTLHPLARAKMKLEQGSLRRSYGEVTCITLGKYSIGILAGGWCMGKAIPCLSQDYLGQIGPA